MHKFKERYEHRFRRHPFRRPSPAGRALAGIVVIIVGILFLMKKTGVYFPEWAFSVPTLLIAIGVFWGAKRLFRGAGWLIIILIGGALLVERLIPGMPVTNFLWPALIILVGVAMVLGSRKKRYDVNCETSFTGETEISSENIVRSTSIFGGVKKNVISKNFKGGEVVCIFGGAEINLAQADINGTVEMEFVQVFGGTKLVVPSNWRIHHEMTAILGGIEDNRPGNMEEDASKVLVLKGVVVFGGVEINSY